MNINSNDKSNLKTVSFDLRSDFSMKQKKLEYDMMKENYNKFYDNVGYKTELLNIDSSYRNKIPKNIYKSNNDILPNNPISVSRNSNQITINYPNHNFSIGDNIIIQNAIGNYKILSNSLYFFNQFPYMFINFNNHNVPLDFLNFYNEYQLSIEIINDIGTNTYYSNIPINQITGIFNITLPSIVNKTLPLTPEILLVFNVNTVAELDPNYLMIELPYNFVISSNNYYVPSDVFKFSFLNIGGIPLPYINSDYPINYTHYQGYQEIINIDTNNIYIKSSITASNSIASGGNYVQIMLITNSIAGYPNANSYTINLKKNFNNVVRIELVSTEFPYIDFLVKTNINNKLYWKNLDDGNYVYQTSIPEGNYDSTSLVNAINLALNSTPRYTSTQQNPIYNIFTASLDTFSQEFKIICYKNNNLPNSLTATLENINGVDYVKLIIYHPNNLVNTNQTITISEATQIGNILTTNYINTDHVVYSIDTSNQTYSVLIAPLNQITNSSNVDLTGNGGPATIVKTYGSSGFLFDKSDTLGNILGFKNVGQKNAITPFNSIISNLNPYIQYTNLNSVGNIDNSISLINLSGNYYYILMYINDYECITNNSNQPTAFAKILLNGNPGDILFNSFINYPLEFDFPISTLNELSIYFTYPDGTLVDFRNIDHSFTLRIIEEIKRPYNTRLNSKDTSFFETIKKVDLT